METWKIFSQNNPKTAGLIIIVATVAAIFLAPLAISIIGFVLFVAMCVGIGFLMAYIPYIIIYKAIMNEQPIYLFWAWWFLNLFKKM